MFRVQMISGGLGVYRQDFEWYTEACEAAKRVADKIPEVKAHTDKAEFVRYENKKTVVRVFEV